MASHDTGHDRIWILRSEEKSFGLLKSVLQQGGQAVGVIGSGMSDAQAVGLDGQPIALDGYNAGAVYLVGCSLPGVRHPTEVNCDRNELLKPHAFQDCLPWTTLGHVLRLLAFHQGVPAHWRRVRWEGIGWGGSFHRVDGKWGVLEPGELAMIPDDLVVAAIDECPQCSGGHQNRD